MCTAFILVCLLLVTIGLVWFGLRLITQTLGVGLIIPSLESCSGPYYSGLDYGLWSVGKSICLGAITSSLDFGRFTHGVLLSLFTLGLSF